MNKRTFFAPALALITAMAALASCASAGGGASAREYNQYTLHFSGGYEGTVTVTKDAAGTITIIANTTGMLPTLTHDLCPLIPAGKRYTGLQWGEGFDNFMGKNKLVIDRNTAIFTDNTGGWVKATVDGNTTTLTSNSPFNEGKIVVDGNTVTEIYGSLKIVKVTNVSGNTTTVTGTYNDQYTTWRNTSVYVTTGNTTVCRIYDRNNQLAETQTTVVNGNTTTFSSSELGTSITVVNKNGPNIYINVQSQRR